MTPSWSRDPAFQRASRRPDRERGLRHADVALQVRAHPRLEVDHQSIRRRRDNVRAASTLRAGRWSNNSKRGRRIGQLRAQRRHDVHREVDVGERRARRGDRTVGDDHARHVQSRPSDSADGTRRPATSSSSPAGSRACPRRRARTCRCTPPPTGGRRRPSRGPCPGPRARPRACRASTTPVGGVDRQRGHHEQIQGARRSSSTVDVDRAPIARPRSAPAASVTPTVEIRISGMSAVHLRRGRCSRRAARRASSPAPSPSRRGPPPRRRACRKWYANCRIRVLARLPLTRRRHDQRTDRHANPPLRATRARPRA